MSSDRLQPLLLDSGSLPPVPPDWRWTKLEDATIALPVGRKYDGKTVVPGGIVPVIDQSPSGVMGHHNDAPGVPASLEDPVFTFANHTCAMRWMTGPFSCIQNVFVFQAREGLDTRYIYYAAQGRVVLEEYKGHAPTFRSMFIPVPPLPEQTRIARLLAVLDNRITLLRETNATLEAIAQALFKSWFVDFDPVRAKQAGRAPEGMDDATAALFPESFEDSELGEVPRGWTCSSLGALCTRVESGGTPKRSVPSYWSGCVPWLTSGEVRNPIVFDTKETISDLGVAESSAKLWPAGTTVVAMYGATAGEVCLLAKPATANQACCGLLPRPGFRAFLFFATRREREALAAKSSGSAQQNLNKGLVESHRLVRPPEVIAFEFESTIGQLLNGWIANEERGQTLTALRDTLLPRLISGQLRLPEAAEFVEEALA
ncbi:restriction endonuclease subunit S [Inhella proteolytica]|uniref:Restriction endonuclease subunit S n=1 Tax=Inhella proteolytica TaxID=2795029 RepID=A0A931J442_9BURK|nr:restriction endonuclease subunit S [Inhella proteolytica]MBH9577855.1 restriction endonuclease subunit S [Inhella proteolytica]